MGQYDFTLKFALGQQDADPESFIENLMNEGCDDALIGIGSPGRIALDFTREANSADEAVISALADVKRAIPDAEFIEAAPDFVGVPDIAKLLDVSRQAIGKLIDKYEPFVPPPSAMRPGLPIPMSASSHPSFIRFSMNDSGSASC